MNGLFDSLRTERLQWLPDLGVGWYPVTAEPYDEAYWDKYRGYDATEMGRQLTAARVALVNKYWDGLVLDVGIGGGRFVEEVCGMGYDVNPAAVQWLKKDGRWGDPGARQFDAMCFWDSLEHIHDPRPILANCRRFAFISLPIFESPSDILQSKHYRRQEHCWYFTRRGLVGFMALAGFWLLETNWMESDLGRDGIASFAFERVQCS